MSVLNRLRITLKLLLLLIFCILIFSYIILNAHLKVFKQWRLLKKKWKFQLSSLCHTPFESPHPVFLKGTLVNSLVYFFPDPFLYRY